MCGRPLRCKREHVMLRGRVQSCVRPVCAALSGEGLAPGGIGSGFTRSTASVTVAVMTRCPCSFGTSTQTLRPVPFGSKLRPNLGRTCCGFAFGCV